MIMVKVLVAFFEVVETCPTVVVGVALGVLAVTVMCMVDACTSDLNRRPGSKMMGSNMLGSTNAFCMLDRITADIVVMGAIEFAVDKCSDE